jgi:hypothetical protein
MTAQITVTLPEDVLQRAELWARRAGRPVTELLAEAIELSLRPLGAPPNGEKPLAAWSDEEVLAAADAQMPAADDQRLSELLYRQQAGLLSDAQRGELAALMQLYQAALLHKAQALREVVRRGLREPLQP